MDKLADNLQRLQEDDLLQVVQMIHDHKSNDTFTKNDIEGKSSGLVRLIGETKGRIKRANSTSTSTPCLTI